MGARREVLRSVWHGWQRLYLTMLPPPRQHLQVLRIVSPDKIPGNEAGRKAENSALNLAPPNSTPPCCALCRDLRLKLRKLVFKVLLL